MGRRIGLAMAAMMFVLLACGCEKDEEPGESGEAAGEAASSEEGDSAASSLQGHQPHFDMMRLVHLADVDHRGLFIDFGTPARMKYTLGHWRTGWGSDGVSEDSTYSYVGDRGRLYFDLDEASPLTVRLRLRPIGTTVVSPYLNGEPVEMIRFQEGTGFRDYEVKVPEDLVRAGENELMLVFGDTTTLGDEEVAVAMESIRVVPGEGPGEGEYAAPVHGSLAGEVKVGDESRPALAVRTPTTLRYHTQVPSKAKLAFGLGAVEGSGAKARVTVTPATGAGDTVFEEPVTDAWTDHVVDLGAYAGRVVRIDLAVEGGKKGRVAWSQPAIAVPEAAPSEDLKQAKNVVLLLVDTLRASKLQAFNPKTRVETPHLDEVAEAGTVFEVAQAPENWTKPSVASLLTGLFPATHDTKRDASRLPDSALMLSEHYKSHGFGTASFIANGYVSRKFGFDQGWDHHTNYIRESKSTEAENVFKEAGDWIEQNKDERFFVYIQTIDPHVPYDPPDSLLKKYDDRDYDGQVKPRMTAQLIEKAKRNPPAVTFDASDKRRLEALHDGEITYQDAEMGKFVERMKKLGLWEDTLFVMTSDHGEEFNEHGSWGHGHSTYQEMLHVPLVFHMNGTVPGGKRVQDVVSLVDVAPTLLELSGVKPMPAAEGRNLTGYLRGETPEEPAVAFSDFLDDRRVITAGRWKLVLRGLTADFYDLEEDPGEEEPLSATRHPIAFRYCRAMLGQFLGSTDRSSWFEGGQGEGTDLDSEEADMDDTTREQLEALGYAN
ncbi:MAG: sulfatase [Myxococcota bacterium]